MVSFSWRPDSQFLSSPDNWPDIFDYETRELPVLGGKDSEQQVLVETHFEAKDKPSDKSLLPITVALRKKQENNHNLNSRRVIALGRRRSPPKVQRPVSPLRIDSPPEIEKDEISTSQDMLNHE